jgi:sigma-B regulation protein RsbU (phosphoserine phosphatase)
MRILIAEDNPVSRYLLENFLQKWGYEVVSAADGAEAWQLFVRDEFPIVISDWMMPEMDGLELIHRIRSCQRPGYVYIMLLTAKSQKTDLVQGMEGGADDFVTKPFDRDELRVRLQAGERIIRLEQSLAQRNKELAAANANITSANERMKKDLQAAAQAQEAFLPSAPPDVRGVNFAWMCKPCEELAGDILNVFWLDEKHVGLYLLDVSGHGVAAALLSVTLSRVLVPAPDQSSLLRQPIAGSSGHRPVLPARVAEQLNRLFPMDPTTGQYFTLLYGILDLDTGEFHYVAAGHPGPIYLPHNTEPKILAVPALPIGICKEARYEEHSVSLRPGDRLYLYSDGITEAENRNTEPFGKPFGGPCGEPFGEDRLSLVLAQARTLPLQESLSFLWQGVEKWCGGAGLKDDVSLLAVEIAENQ